MLTLAMAIHLAANPPAPATDARRWVETAVQRMGGVERLRSLSTLRMETVGYRNLLEQSERPEGPWIPQIERTTEVWDAKSQSWSVSSENAIADEHFNVLSVVSGGAAGRKFGDAWQPGLASQVAEAEETMGLSPHRALLAALDTRDLIREPDVAFQGVRNHAASYSRWETRVRLLFSTQTGFLSAVETTRAYPDDLYWQVWGDVATRISYSLWDLRPGGLFYPLQWDVERGGRPWRSFTISKLEALQAPPPDAFAIPEDMRKAFGSHPLHSLDAPRLGNPARPAVELAPGVVFIPGSWSVTLVRQEDGIVVLEAPISAGYSAAVLDEAARRFPGVPVKAVVTTSDSWPHFGGIREYAARGIPIYLLDLNLPQIRRALESPHRAHPDAFARQPRAADLRRVAARTVLGKGANRIELYPVRGESGERMMLAYLPESGLLYASDLFQANRNGPPEYAWEVAEVVRVNGLRVQTVFAMHTDPMPWSGLLDLIEKAIKG